MRDAILCVVFFIYFGLQCASCMAGDLNTELARVGIGECATHDCWE